MKKKKKVKLCLYIQGTHYFFWKTGRLAPRSERETMMEKLGFGLKKNGI